MKRGRVCRLAFGSFDGDWIFRDLRDEECVHAEIRKIFLVDISVIRFEL